MFPFLPQEADDFITKGFVIMDFAHSEMLQKKGLDTYFAIVKYRNCV